jgi:hypothetical protein
MDAWCDSSAISSLTHSATLLSYNASDATTRQSVTLFELTALIIFKPAARKFLFQFFQKVGIFFTLLIALVP